MLFNFMRNGFSGANLLNFVIQIAIALPAIIVGLSFHEAAHALAAYRSGDPTAKYMGRLTLNPIKHIDPIGFAMLLLLGFGYAKPVPVNPRNFRNGRRDDLIVSVAGIATNLALCLISCIIFVGFIVYGVQSGHARFDAFGALRFTSYGWVIGHSLILNFVMINMALAIFNLLPIPPLDGSHIFNELLFKGTAFSSQLSSGLGRTILLLLLLTGVVSRIIGFFTGQIESLINWAINLLL